MQGELLDLQQELAELKRSKNSEADQLHQQTMMLAALAGLHIGVCHVDRLDHHPIGHRGRWARHCPWRNAVAQGDLTRTAGDTARRRTG